MLFILSLFSTLTLGILIGAALLIAWFVIKPFLYIRYYKEQGAQGYFKPLGGFFHDRMKEARQHGDFMRYFKRVVDRHPGTRAVVSNVGSQTMLYLIDPELTKEFLNQPHLYRKVGFVAGVEGLFEGQGILFSEGEKWKKQRKLLTSSFHNDLLKEQVPLMAKVSEEVYSSIGKTEKTKDLKHINIMKQNQKIAGDIIGNFFFGPRYSKYSFEGHSLTMGLRKLLKDGFKEMYTIWNGLFGAWFIRAGILPRHKVLMQRIENLRNELKTIINEVKRKGNLEEDNENYLLKTLLKQQEQTPENAMTDEEIIDNFISIFLAGTDPTGNLVSMALYFLSKNPEVYEKTMNEIESTLHGNKDLHFDQTQKLDYTLAVIKETLRKANPQALLVFRESLEDHKIRDFHIKKGTLVTFLPIINGYNKRYFPDFEDFRPERWLPGADKTTELRENPFAFLPFSAGARACLGQHMALIEAKVMLANFLRRFKAEVSSNYDLHMTNRGTYEPLVNMKMSLTAK